jgi:hypothetical protein
VVAGTGIKQASVGVASPRPQAEPPGSRAEPARCRLSPPGGTDPQEEAAVSTGPSSSRAGSLQQVLSGQPKVA